MIKIGNGFFGHPKNLGKECCFAVALINYFRLNCIEINETQLLEKHLSSPYTVQNGGIDMLLQPKQVEYLTDGQYTATLFHLIQPDEIGLVENRTCRSQGIQKNEEIAILEQMIESGQIRYSMEDVRRLSQPLDSLGSLANIYSYAESGIPYEGHAIVRLNPGIYHFGTQTHIDVDGNVYQMEDKDEMCFAGCLEIKT